MINSHQNLRSHKILFQAPLLQQKPLECQSIYGSFVSTPVDSLDLNADGKLEQQQATVARPYGKGDMCAVRQMRSSEPAIVQPTLTAMRNYADKIGSQVLTRQELPNGVFVGTAVAEAGNPKPQTTFEQVQPIETLLYQVTGEINPKAQWAIDFSNNTFVIFEGR